MDTAYIFYVFALIVSILSFLVAIFGTIGNLITCYICTRKSLRSISAFQFIAFMSIIDTISLYFWNLNGFFFMICGVYLSDLSVTSCKITTFLQCFSSQASAAILVVMTYERLLGIKFKRWVTYIKPKKISIICIGIIVFFLALNSHLLFTIDYVIPANSSANGFCGASPMFVKWLSIHFNLYLVVTFCLIFIGNGILIHHLLVIQKKKISPQMTQNIARNRRSFSATLLFFTFSFICFTAPYLFMVGYFLREMLGTELNRFILLFFILVAFTFHASNFIILFFTNKKFSEEFKYLIRSLKNFPNFFLKKTATNTSRMIKPSTGPAKY